jgi:hypothetical protein
MSVRRLSKTSSGFILSDFCAGYADRQQPGLLTNLSCHGAAKSSAFVNLHLVINGPNELAKDHPAQTN